MLSMMLCVQICMCYKRFQCCTLQSTTEVAEVHDCRFEDVVIKVARTGAFTNFCNTLIILKRRRTDIWRGDKVAC